jgi:hypothetical protein
VWTEIQYAWTDFFSPIRKLEHFSLADVGIGCQTGYEIRVERFCGTKPNFA